MTNVDKVKAVLPQLRSRFTTADLVEALEAKGYGMSGKQAGEAVRAVSYVTNHGKGSYSTKGRRVAR